MTVELSSGNAEQSIGSFETWSTAYAAATIAFGERVLSLPWTEATLRARNLLLVSSAGGVFILAGSTNLPDTLARIRTTLGADILLLFVTGTIAYALLAFVSGVVNDRERHRLLMIEPFQQYAAALATVHKAQSSLFNQLGSEASVPQAVVDARRELPTVKARVEELEEEYIGHSRSAEAELPLARSRWNELRATIDAWETARMKSSSLALRELGQYLQAPSYIQSIVSNMFPKAKWQYRFQTAVEAVGPLFLGIPVFLALMRRLIEAW
jgi:hypothetical protein